MTHKVTVRFGGAADSEVHDYSDRIRLLGDGSPLIYGGMACDNGSAGMGQLILDDVDNDIPHRTEPPGLQLAAHNQLIWSEDSPGYESWLSIGRIDNKTVGRPYTYTAGVNRQWTVQWADANMDFDGLTLTADWVRPAESDVDRVLAAVAAFCNGSPRLTTVFETHLVSSAGAVTMPAKIYPAGTELPELFDDCASQAGKSYSVVIHDLDSASHTCLLYIDEDDHTTYPCTLSISDQLDEVDGETVFEPVWRQGGATEEQGQELITGLVSRYGLDSSAVAVASDAARVAAYDWWMKKFDDDLSVTAAEAAARNTAMLHSRGTEHVTHQPSILIPARLHYLLKAGMSIDIKSAAAMGGQYLNTVQTRRIANIEWSHAGWRGTDAMLWANLQLDRTPRKLPLSIGIKPGPQPPSGSCTDLTGGTELDTFAEHNTTGHWNSNSAFDDISNGDGDGAIGSWRVGFSNVLTPINNFMYYCFTGTFTAGHNYKFGFYYRSTKVEDATFYFGATDTISTSLPAVFTTDSVTQSVTPDGSWHHYEMTWTPATTIVSDGSNATAIGVRWGVDASGSAGGIVAADGGTLEECTGATIPPASDDGTGSSGDAGCTEYACSTHKHPAQTAAVTPVSDSGGYFTGTDQEAVDQEIGAELADHESRIDTLETATGVDASVASLLMVIDGGGSAIGTGVKGDIIVPFDCTIDQVTLLADQSGSIVVDLWKDTYANYPPTIADTITASAKPTLSSAAKSQDATLTGWTTSISAGDTLRVNVDSASTVTRVTLALKVTRT